MENIKVALRFRPLNPSEIQQNDCNAWNIINNKICTPLSISKLYLFLNFDII